MGHSGATGRTVAIVAGEASGDLHGSMLVTKMKSMYPEISFFGIGGGEMEKAGVSLDAHASDLAIVGITEVFSRLPVILGIRRSFKNILRQRRPDLLVLIDLPDFNMPLAKFAHKLGIPVFYYISPQVWAWRKRRIFFLEKYLDGMAVILPFEEEVYRETSLDVRFVGHPLIDRVVAPLSRGETASKLGLRPGGKIVALVPGSRTGEVTFLLPTIFEAARIIRERLADVQFVLPLADGISEDFVENARREVSLEVTVVRNSFYDALGIADGAIVASGTSTLETALLEVPMVIIYKVSYLSYLLGRLFIKVDSIGLVNIIAGKRIVPEFIQGDAQPEIIAGELLELMANEERRKLVKSDLQAVKQALGEPGAAGRAAAMALEIMKKRQPRSSAWQR